MSLPAREDLIRALETVPWIQVAASGFGLFVTYNAASFAYDYWRKSQSPLRELPTPKDRAGWIFGHIPAMFRSESNQTQERWADELGDTFAIRNFLGKYQLLTTDTRAVTHILFASHIYGKSALTISATKRFVGDGVLVAEGDRHRDQRRILNPAFGFAQIRNLTGIFLDKSVQLCSIWHEKCIANGGSTQLNALDWLSKTTLDAIGKAGFDYDFGTLNDKGQTNELAEAFDRLFRTDLPLREQMRFLLNNRFPVIRAVAPGRRDKIITDSRKTMDEVGMRIVQEKKAAILAGLDGADGEVAKSAVEGKDLISQLLRANLASDLDPLLRLSDQEVVDQIPTFLVAGHETTSSTTTWAMYALAQNADMQTRLRQELLDAPETPTLDALNALPYLDKVTREVLRLYAVVAFVDREAYSDDLIPLRKPIVDRTGKTITEIRVQKGDQEREVKVLTSTCYDMHSQVTIPIWLLNRSKTIWGEDADQFRPDRWDDPPAEASGFPGITPNLMSFIGGPRSCIGFRFAIAEIKALLFHIVRRFEWKLAVKPSDLWSRTAPIMRPQRRGSNNVELPVIITAIA